MIHTAIIVLSYGAAILFGVPIGAFLAMWTADYMLSKAIGKRGG